MLKLKKLPGWDDADGLEGIGFGWQAKAALGGSQGTPGLPPEAVEMVEVAVAAPERVTAGA